MKLSSSLLVMLLLVTPMGGAELVGPMAEWKDLLGTWEVATRWEGGSTVWARSSFVVGIGGRTIEARILVKDGDGVPYQRYLTIYRHDNESGAWMAHTFHRDGSSSTSEVSFQDGVLLTEWTEGETRIRDRSALVEGGRLHWTVEVASSSDGEFQKIMDATWHRVGGKMIQPIDTNLFSHDEETTDFEIEAVVAAPVEDVFAAWTNGEAFKAAYGPDREELAANIDLAIGGRYEWLWDGKTGSNDCQILSFIPDRMISFSWNAPPDQPDSRAQRTWVVVEFTPVADGGTHVRLTHLGWGQAAHWQETKEYFQKAWPYVLEQFRKHLGGPARM